MNISGVEVGPPAEAGGGKGTAPAPRRTFGLRAGLVLLVVAVLAPAILLSIILLWDTAQSALRNQERQLAATARAMALVVDRQLSEQVGLAEALAVSQPLRNGRYAEFDGQAREALKSSRSWVVVRGPGGRQFVNTMLPPGARLPTGTGGGAGADVTWAGLRGDVGVSNVFYGTVARQPVVVVKKPLRLSDGRAGDLNIVTAAATFGEILQRQELPDGWIASILDGEGRIVARNRGGPELVGRSASPDLMARLKSDNFEVTPSRNIEGVPTYVAMNRLADFGWTALIAVPRDDIIGPARRSMMLALTAGTLLLAISVLLALYIARRIAGPVESLASAAEDWVAGGNAAFPAHTGLTEMDSLSRSLQIARSAVEAHDARQQLLINELNHRVKNTLSTVQAITRHSLKGDTSAADFQAAVEGRLMAMSAAHDLLNSTAWAGAELGDLARLTLRPFAGPRLRIEGPSAQVTPSHALNLSLIFYELATNAAKHGALSTEAGSVTLSWTREGDRVCLTWAEAGGPEVKPPTRKGFGSRLIRQVLKGMEPSEVRFDPTGVVCCMTLKAPPPPL